jgi:hemerythrin-like domain-containing protein
MVHHTAKEETVSAILDKLHKDHRNLNRLLDVIERQMARFHDAEPVDLELLIDVLDYIGHYADQVHHPTEDAIFDYFAPRADARAKDAIAVLQAQHRALSEKTCEFRNTLEGVVQGDVVTRQEVENESRAFVSLQRVHLDTEERDIFPIIAAALTPEDWKRVAEHVPVLDDPLFGDQVLARYKSLYQHILSEAL